ncbi:hypothetical protein L3Y34_019586 [Caenorhabditis briggsae]|uniref:Uncharacterized protein n=1 Tax=Caenorhabditis briggsae TaxID=6238 RepID=A0AAE9IW50_CAEBR|nr:hypothetical protein L3Y34_019586 [Caenorhabditis briggsae]
MYSLNHDFVCRSLPFSLIFSRNAFFDQEPSSGHAERQCLQPPSSPFSPLYNLADDHLLDGGPQFFLIFSEKTTMSSSSASTSSSSVRETLDKSEQKRGSTAVAKSHDLSKKATRSSKLKPPMGDFSREAMRSCGSIGLSSTITDSNKIH